MPRSLTPAEPARQAMAARRCCRPFTVRGRPRRKSHFRGSIRAAFAFAVYASQAPLRCHPRKTRFRLAATLCRTGLVTRQVPSRKVSDSVDSASTSSFPFPRLCLAHTAYEVNGAVKHHGG